MWVLGDVPRLLSKETAEFFSSDGFAPSNRLVIRNDNTKDTCCTLPLYDSSTVNTNCSEEIQV
jgi:hypothetical protein